MPADESLARSLRAVVAHTDGMVEKKMFGGLPGRPMKGWLLVSADVLSDPAALRAWVERGVSYARSLPPK
jgi:hypothetical protein